jgi:hypothetical protein
MTFQRSFQRPYPTVVPTLSNAVTPAFQRVCSPTLYTTYMGGLPPAGSPAVMDDGVRRATSRRSSDVASSSKITRAALVPMPKNAWGGLCAVGGYRFALCQSLSAGEGPNQRLPHQEGGIEMQSFGMILHVGCDHLGGLAESRLRGYAETYSLPKLGGNWILIRASIMMQRLHSRCAQSEHHTGDNPRTHRRSVARRSLAKRKKPITVGLGSRRAGPTDYQSRHQCSTHDRRPPFGANLS